MPDYKALPPTARSSRRLPRNGRAEARFLRPVAIAVIVLISYPLAFILGRSISQGRVGSPLTLTWLRTTVTNPQLQTALVNTLVYAVGSTVLAMCFGTCLAFFTSRTNMPGRKLVSALSITPLLIPPFVLVVGWTALGAGPAGVLNVALSQIFGTELTAINIASMPGIIWVTGLFLTPYVYLLMFTAFRNADSTLEDAARITGAPRMRILKTVTIPIQRPALLSAVLLTFILSAGDFVIPSTLGLSGGIELLPSLIWRNTAEFPGAPGIAASQALILVFVGLGCIMVQRRALGATGRFATISGRHGGSSLFDLGRWRIVTSTITILVMLSATLLPLLAVALMSFVRYWSPTGITPSNFTLDNFEYILFNYPQLWPSVTNSIGLAVISAPLIALVGLSIAYFARRSSGVLARSVELVAIIPLGVPGVAMGVGLLNAWIIIPGGIYGTHWILLVAYVTSLLPIAVQFSASALDRIQIELEQVARVAGASWLRAVRTILLPILLPALVSGAFLLYVLILREVSTVILLYNPSTIVLPVGLFDVWLNGTYPKLAVYSLVLLVLGAVPLGAWGLWRLIRSATRMRSATNEVSRNSRDA